MITGLLLLYIGYRFEFPTWYVIGCFAVIGWNLATFLTGFKKGYEEGLSKEE